MNHFYIFFLIWIGNFWAKMLMILYVEKESMVLFFLSVQHQMKLNQNQHVRTRRAPATQAEEATRHKEERGRVKYIKVTGGGFLVFFPLVSLGYEACRSLCSESWCHVKLTVMCVNMTHRSILPS